MHRIAFALAFALCACEEEVTPPPIGDTDASTPITHPGGASCAFVPQGFTLPAVSNTAPTPFAAMSGQTACTSSTSALDYFLADLDEDGLADLIVTSACDDASVGVTRWLVYRNEGSGFGTATSYAIPSAPPGCLAFGLADVDADGGVDLVVTASCNDASVGTSRWLVYRNVGGGFSNASTSFALPNVVAGAFPSLEVDAATCQSGKPAFAFFDINGDAFPDLVVTTACDDASIGVGRWRVYPGSSTGLGAAASFPLPAAGTFASPFAGAMASCADPAPSPSYALVDFDGNFTLDLVVTESCADASIGATRWAVYPNDGTAFASNASFVALPGFAGATSHAFAAIDDTTACVSGTLSYALADADGDFKPDLVVTSACDDAAIGVAEWLVYPNHGTSFDAPKSYALPTELGATSAAPVTALTGVVSCTGTPRAAFTASHFLGAELELVITRSCADATVGASRWIVDRAQCSP